MTSDPKNSNTFISILVLAFQKNIVWKKSKNSLFRSIFKYDLRGLKWSETKINPQRLRFDHPSTSLMHLNYHSLIAPHAPHCTSLHLVFCFLWGRSSHFALLSSICLKNWGHLPFAYKVEVIFYLSIKLRSSSSCLKCWGCLPFA